MKRIYAVGTGPGNPELLTGQARRVIESCSVLAGYELYIKELGDLAKGKKLIEGNMFAEVDRCREALEYALRGETVAMVSSGDAGVYGMAGLLYELVELERYREIEIEVVPGVTAALAAAALAGAPLMNDFAVVSLSDLMTPKELIQKRLKALAEADFVTVLYNPASTRRRELLPFAVETFQAAGGDLPAALVKNAYRENEEVRFCTLGNFPFDAVGMTTVVILGNSDTIFTGKRLYVPRGYREKYGFTE